MCGDEVTSRTDPHRDIDLRIKLWNLKVVMLSVWPGLFHQCGRVHEIPYKEGRKEGREGGREEGRKEGINNRAATVRPISFFTNFDYIQANYTTYMMIVLHLYTTSSYQKKEKEREPQPRPKTVPKNRTKKS